jgi:DNA-binding protein HU-beta
MNKTELIAKIAEAGFKKVDAEKALNATIDAITGALKANDKVSIMGFGSFEVRERAARTGINPQTKAEIKIAASKAPVFKAGKAFKDAIK